MKYMMTLPGTSREEYRQALLYHVYNNKNNKPPFTEEDVEKFVHVEFDEIDAEKEFLVLFHCEEVALYLSELLDEEDVREYLHFTLLCPDEVPHIMLAQWRPDKIPDISMEEVLSKIRQIYKDNSMVAHEIIAEQAQKVAADYDRIEKETEDHSKTNMFSGLSLDELCTLGELIASLP